MLRMKLHSKFLFLVLGTLVLFLGIMSYAMVQREAALLERKAEEKQHILAFTVYSDLKDSMMEGKPRSTLKLMDSLRGEYGLVRLETLRNDGRPAFGIPGSRLNLPQLEQVFASGREISFSEEGVLPAHTILFPLKNEQECRTCHAKQPPILGVLLITLSRQDTVNEIEASTRRLSLSLLALILLIGGLLYFMIRKVVLRPLEILHQGADRIGRGDLAHRIALKTNDEIQDLARSFNIMAGYLEESYSGLEKLIKDRTHEVEDKAKKLYSFSRDMATISRLSTKVFNAEQSLDEMLDRFMLAVGQGLGYNRSLLCLVDRKRAWLEIKRDTGLSNLLGLASCPLSDADPFAKLVRSGKAVSVEDFSRDPVFNRYRREATAESRALHIVPILTGTHEKRCWQAKNCSKTFCPAYQAEDAKCWLVENTLCGNELIESYGDKLSYCMSCDVFPVLGVLVVAAKKLPLKHRELRVLRILASEMGAALRTTVCITITGRWSRSCSIFIK